MTEDILNVTVSEGKYTLIIDEKGRAKARRYGEPWPAFEGQSPDNLHISLAWEVKSLRDELAALTEAA